MTKAPISWYHCGRCGSLFRSTLGDDADRTCATCGAKPSLGVDPPAKTQPATSPAAVEMPGSSGERKRTKGHRRSHRGLLLKLILGWTLFLGAIIFGARLIWDDSKENPSAKNSGSDQTSQSSMDDQALLERALKPCNTIFARFLAAPTPEERNEFVLSPVETVSRMSRLERTNPTAPIDSKDLELRNAGIVRLPGRTVVEMQWAGPDGRSMDAAFTEVGGDWKLDWDHFVRFSDQRLSFFLSGHGDSEGMFRVLAREPLASERQESKNIAIVLYEPEPGRAGEIGRQSQEFVIPRDSTNGRLLEAAFKLESEGKRVFGSTLPRIDPKDLIRLRIKLVRRSSPGADTFEIDQILAGHWYEIEDSGLIEMEKSGSN